MDGKGGKGSEYSLPSNMNEDRTAVYCQHSCGPQLWKPEGCPVGVLHHCIFIISQLWLTSRPRGAVVLLDTGTPCTSREIYSEDANCKTRTCNPWITNPVV